MIEKFKEQVVRNVELQDQTIAVIKTSLERIKDSGMDMDVRIDSLCQIIDMVIDLHATTSELLVNLTEVTAATFEAVADKFE